MSNPNPDRKVLEDLWRSRLNDVKLRVEFAQNYVNEVEFDFPTGDTPTPDGTFAHQYALRAENHALAEYNRVLRIYTALVVDGTIPDEGEWLRRNAASASDFSVPAKSRQSLARTAPPCKGCRFTPAVRSVSVNSAASLLADPIAARE